MPREGLGDVHNLFRQTWLAGPVFDDVSHHSQPLRMCYQP